MLGFRVQGTGFRIVGFRVLGFRVQGTGFRVYFSELPSLSVAEVESSAPDSFTHPLFRIRGGGDPKP